MTPAEFLLTRFKAADLGVADEAALSALIDQYVALAALRTEATPEQQQAHVEVLLLEAQIAQAARSPASFSVPGQISLTFSVDALLSELRLRLRVARRAAGLLTGTGGMRKRSSGSTPLEVVG